jgi:hypothetical protein
MSIALSLAPRLSPPVDPSTIVGHIPGAPRDAAGA